MKIENKELSPQVHKDIYNVFHISDISMNLYAHLTLVLKFFFLVHCLNVLSKMLYILLMIIKDDM
jgi:hypothetical protein